MFRKLILSAILATGTITGLTISAQAADASPATLRHGFVVFAEFRHRWEERGAYPNRYDAERLALRLRHEGYRVEIRQF